MERQGDNTKHENGLVKIQCGQNHSSLKSKLECHKVMNGGARKVFWDHKFSRKVKVLVAQSQFFVTPWTVAHQAPLSKEFSRQEYWSG